MYYFLLNAFCVKQKRKWDFNHIYINNQNNNNKEKRKKITLYYVVGLIESPIDERVFDNATNKRNEIFPGVWLFGRHQRDFSADGFEAS